MKYQER